MAHGDAQPHARALDVVEEQVVQHGQHDRAERQHGGVDVGLPQSRGVGGVVVFKIINDFPQKYGLGYSDALLKRKEGAEPS